MKGANLFDLSSETAFSVNLSIFSMPGAFMDTRSFKKYCCKVERYLTQGGCCLSEIAS